MDSESGDRPGECDPRPEIARVCTANIAGGLSEAELDTLVARVERVRQAAAVLAELDLDGIEPDAAG